MRIFSKCCSLGRPPARLTPTASHFNLDAGWARIVRRGGHISASRDLQLLLPDSIPTSVLSTSSSSSLSLSLPSWECMKADRERERKEDKINNMAFWKMTLNLTTDLGMRLDISKAFPPANSSRVPRQHTYTNTRISISRWYREMGEKEKKKNEVTDFSRPFCCCCCAWPWPWPWPWWAVATTTTSRLRLDLPVWEQCPPQGDGRVG